MAIEVGAPLEINLVFPGVKDLGAGQLQSPGRGLGGCILGSKRGGAVTLSHP